MEVVALLQPWAIDHEQTYHSEALQSFGEKVIVRVAWQVQDFEAGIVERCTECMQGGTLTIQQRYSDLYKEAGDSRCLNCFGIGFDGGFRPTTYIVYMLAVDDPDQRQRGQTGEVYSNVLDAQFLWEPVLAEGDMIVRVDEWVDDVTPASEEGRYRLDDISQQSVRTGQRMSNTDEITVSQQGRISRLPPDNIYYEVPVG